MVKKKEDVVVVRKKSLSYKDIVDDMSDESFNFCVSLLYPLLGYQVMGQDEVRRVDLKEKLLELEGQIPSAKNAKYPGILNYYLFILKQYFDKVLTCKEGSRAEKYKSRAYEMMDKALGENGSTEDVDDIFLVFILLLRRFGNLLPVPKNIKLKPLEDIVFDVGEDDGELLRNLYDTKEGIPEGIVDRGLLGVIRNTDEEETALRILYINNVIFLSRALQHFGGYKEEKR